MNKFSKFDVSLLSKESTIGIVGGCHRTDWGTLNGKKTNHHDPGDSDNTTDSETDHCGGDVPTPSGVSVG